MLKAIQAANKNKLLARIYSAHLLFHADHALLAEDFDTALLHCVTMQQLSTEMSQHVLIDTRYFRTTCYQTFVIVAKKFQHLTNKRSSLLEILDQVPSSAGEHYQKAQTLSVKLYKEWADEIILSVNRQ